MFNHLTCLAFHCSFTGTPGAQEALEDFQARIPLLRVATPRLQKLCMRGGSWCDPELITGCTGLQHVMLTDPSLPLCMVDDWMRALGAAVVPTFSGGFSGSDFLGTELVDPDELEPVDRQEVATHVFRWAQNLRGARSVTFDMWDGCVPLVVLLRPLAAGLADGRVEELTGKCAIGTAEEAAAALLCLPMLQRLERLTIGFDVKPHGIGAVPPPVPSEETLRALLAPLLALRPCAPALQRVTLRVPVQAALPRGTLSWSVVEELCSAHPGLSIDFC